MDANIKNYYYVTCATGLKYIHEYAQFAVKSLLLTGVNPFNIHVCVRDQKEAKEFRGLVPKEVCFHVVWEDIDKVRWKYSGGYRKFSLFKIGALTRIFPKPFPQEAMLYFDGDVLFFKDPKPFLNTVCGKTWFHHVKDYSFRATRDFGITERDVDPKDYNSLSKWVPPTMAYLLLKYGFSQLPKTHACAGLFLLHPRDHKTLLRKTYEYSWDIAKNPRFDNDSSVGDQKPMNAVLSIYGIDWHGGHKDQFADCQKYMNHYFGIDEMKSAFCKKVKELGL